MGALAFLIVPRFLTKTYAAVSVPCRTMNIKPELWDDGSWCLAIPGCGHGTKSYFLNSTAAEIWNLIDGRRSEEEIAEIISEKYSLSRKEAASAVKVLITSMKEQNLLV